MTHFFGYCDGSIVPKNPGGHAVGGWVLRDQNGDLIAKGTVDLGSSPTVTNNEAEYAAIEGLLKYMIEEELAYGTLIVCSDSQLVVNQLTDVYKCNAPNLQKYREDILRLLPSFDNEVLFKWIPREENKEADAVSRSLYETDDEHE